VVERQWRLFSDGFSGQNTTAKAQKMHDMQFALGAAGGVSGSASSMIPGIFFSKNGGGDALFIAAAGRTQLTKLADEKIGDIDCYVVRVP